MSEKKLLRACGNWVDGERFWDREAEIGLFVEYLEEGANILLTAQRRIGKTSLMREVGSRISDKHVSLHIELERALSAEEAVVELAMAGRGYQKIWEKIGGVFSSILDIFRDNIESVNAGEIEVKIRSEINKGNWRVKGDRVFAALAEAERPVVLFFDEVPVMVNRVLKGEDYKITPERIRDADIFMSWLRDNALKHTGKLRMVFTGSIGFEPVLRQAGLSATINHLKALELTPWDEATAVGCLAALANQYGVTFEEGVKEYMVEKLGCCIPHHVQMYFDYIYEYGKKRGEMDCSKKDAKEVYKHSMLSTRGHVELSHFEERLRQVLGSDILPFVFDLLTEAATEGYLSREAIEILGREHKDRFGEREEGEVLREVLGVLEHDGYFKMGSKGYIFESKLLRDWWKRRFGEYYTPAKERGKKS